MQKNMISKVKLVFCLLSIAASTPAYGWFNPIECAEYLSEVEWSKHLSGIDWTDFTKKVSYDTAKTTALASGAIFVFYQMLPALAKNLHKSKYPKAFEFIKEELVKAGLDSNDVTIKGTAPYAWGTILTLFGTYLFAPENALIEIENMLTEHPDSPLLDRYRFVINHEANHILLKHGRKRLLPTVGAIATSAFVYKGLAYIINNKLEIVGGEKGIDGPALSSLTRDAVDAGLKAAATVAILLTHGAFTRPQEQEADDTTRDEISVLKGGIKYFDELEKLTDDNFMMQLFNSYWGNILSAHPSIPHRIETLKERVSELEHEAALEANA